MNREPSFNFHYQIGGSLPADAPTYIVRQADKDIFNALLAREYCYVLNARQMGKSSLRVRTMSKLKARGIACGEIELSGIGSQQITAQQWYGGIVREIIDGFELQIDRRSWWRERDDLSPVQRLGEFIETVLLKQISGEIIVFVDEIDSILSLDFPTDDFLGLIHNFYNKRASKPEYRRLTFSLMGVATPAELMRDTRSTPFNIGRAIALQGFALEESFSLMAGFEDRINNPIEILDRVLFWTGGQPFLTQKLCQAIAKNAGVVSVRAVDKLVRESLVRNWESQDNPEHLRTIRDRLCVYSHRQFSQTHVDSSYKLLRIYSRILQRGQIPLRNCQEHLELQLSGIVSGKRGNLVVKNLIYKSVFDLQWVRERLKELDRYKKRQFSGKKVVFLTLAIAGAILGIRSLGWLQTWELQSFDLLMRWRPQELPDERILIVKVTKDDIEAQPAIERGASSISDRSLAKLLNKLARSPATAIGLDIYREIPLQAPYQSQIELVKQSDRFFAICNYGDPGVEAASQIIFNDGFNNVVLDPDGVIRRQIVAVNSAAPCRSKYALNWQLATHYLETAGIKTAHNERYLQVGNTPFKPLAITTGGYQKIDRSGNQVLLNCRNSEQIAPQVTLQEFLNDSFDLDLVRDRIILIGTTASSFKDNRWRTSCDDMETGVEIQAQMVSQILSAVLDERPLLKSLASWGEMILIVSCASIGGILTYYQRSLRQLAGRIGLTVIFIVGSSEILIITIGIWLPLFSSLLAFTLTSSSIFLLRKSHRDI